MGLKYSISYKVPYYQSSAAYQMTIPAVLDVALQLSGTQSTLLGRSDGWVRDHYDFAWIVTEYALDIHRLPAFSEELTIETEALSYNKFFCYRDFNFRDKSGELLLRIHSTWVLLDIENRKVGRIVEEIVSPYQAAKADKLEKSHSFVKFETADKQRNYKVRFSDLDINQHVNNSKYIDWALDLLEPDFLMTHQPEKMFIRYNHEVRATGEISSSVKFEDRLSCHQINDKDAQIEILWRENDH